MKTKIDRLNKVVFFEGDYPSVMRRQFPDHTYRVLSPREFNGVDLPLISPSNTCGDWT